MECQLEQPRLMSGCSWCEAAETEGDSWIQSTPPLIASGKAEELEVSETSPERAQEAKHCQGTASK